MMNKESADLTKNLQELIKVKGPEGVFEVAPEKIGEALFLLRSEMGMLPKTFSNVAGSLVETVNPLKEVYKESIKILETQQKEYENRQKVVGLLKGAGLTYTEKVTKETVKTTEKAKEQTVELEKQYDIMNDIYARMREMEDEDTILGDVGIGSGKPGTGRFDRIWDPKKKFFKESVEEAQDPMQGLVSLSNQMASNFQWAGHTFVGQLSQAIAMVDSISNMILAIASMFGGGGGFGIGGLLSLIGLEKGGRVSNRFGNVSVSNIPSFAMGGSYSTPAFSGPMAGGYPVMVHKNETLDVYNAGQSSRMEKKLDGIRNAILTTNLHVSKKSGGGSQPIIINVDGQTLFKVNTRRNNRASRAGVNTGEMI
ncbi:hypothetical protein LDC_2479 [sediment metagenome]|uniref:Uncharacterized protein n=1 Tax=sediment metagenome TaxID=749907 RepID=D9PLQ6_9ZZZZ